jgi:hypothetical protein
LLLIAFWPTYAAGQKAKKDIFQIFPAGEALAATLSEKNPKNVFQFVAMISRK